MPAAGGLINPESLGKDGVEALWLSLASQAALRARGRSCVCVRGQSLAGPLRDEQDQDWMMTGAKCISSPWEACSTAQDWGHQVRAREVSVAEPPWAQGG